jgi:hypothetical protein
VTELAPPAFSGADPAMYPFAVKTIIRGYSWAVIPITWWNRRAGVTKLEMLEMAAAIFSFAFT